MAKDRRRSGTTGDWSTTALDPGVKYNIVCEGRCRFMAAWVKEEEKASENRQRKREAEETEKVEVTPGVTVVSLKRFRVASIGPTQGLPKRCRLRQTGSLKTLRVRCYRCFVSGCKCEVIAI